MRAVMAAGESTHPTDARGTAPTRFSGSSRRLVSGSLHIFRRPSGRFWRGGIAGLSASQSFDSDMRGTCAVVFRSSDLLQRCAKSLDFPLQHPLLEWYAALQRYQCSQPLDLVGGL
jgi:hypothetical protein